MVKYVKYLSAEMANPHPGLEGSSRLALRK